mmetsp:Transcript_98/g.163  ORF Transcript_98/g.163 Transcript_98/m.163 type:complete len:157 (+) Transcript_98:60-530(+)|eukprot:CAMPEP_0113628374 /NCGR_PEP_ID=MMETSP0017_2-20120614/14701_1 /TAXON_ID=2856 /ORGANISM="Cylindrotheca closterium" /LENGTH=156 /DNA_ID=CAMNT_0000538675 /DNA_START=25 /DNA_END=495 /DNA_ORIENTATION=- /assembly_acc=CAM_ASM_000147
MRGLLQSTFALLLISVAKASESNNCRFALEVDKESYLPAEEIQVTMTQCNPDLEDFVAIYDADVDPNETRGHVTYLMWMRTCGSSYCSEPADSSTFLFGKGHNKHSWPLPMGRYKVHLLKKKGKREFETYASSQSFMVEDREPKQVKKIEVGSLRK